MSIEAIVKKYLNKIYIDRIEPLEQENERLREEVKKLRKKNRELKKELKGSDIQRYREIALRLSKDKQRLSHLLRIERSKNGR